MVFVTFVVPTVGRPSLMAALASLAAQTDADWSATVVFDGVEPSGAGSVIDADPRLNAVCIPKTGSSASGGTTNRAGAVRNVALDSIAGASEATWVAFLDDDDTLEPTYVAALRGEAAAHPDTDAVVFQMRKGSARLPWDGDVARQTFHKGRVGISFALRFASTVKTGTRFVPSRYEDFNMLDALRRNGATIRLSDAGPQYIVRP